MTITSLPKARSAIAKCLAKLRYGASPSQRILLMASLFSFLVSLGMAFGQSPQSLGNEMFFYRDCLKKGNELYGPCYQAICSYQTCIYKNTTIPLHGVTIKDPGAWGTAMAVCAPYIQQMQQCADQQAWSRANNSPYDAPITADMGTVWDEEESGFHGVWRRRANSNTFDARWGGITAVLEITFQGNRVSIKRRQSSDGNDCDYDGTLSGRTVSGTYHCTKYPGPWKWKATIK
ncbi:MAG: hypothetical protein HYR55_00780 [Acidobacteria bacterium]|nr:hypothetical protein [Acidobacteriota bacterium]MBI3654997.1 hypothetical protein [Acidobacteriota bacterium]